MKNKFLLFLALQLMPLLSLYARNPLPAADLILFNGKIITVDQHFTICEAVAIKQNKILAIGSNREIKKLAGDKTEMIDLLGKTVVPGLIDFHAHPDGAA